MDFGSSSKILCRECYSAIDHISHHSKDFELDSPSATAAAYEEAIAELEAAAARLKRARNSSLSPILKLPIEVLTEIFFTYCCFDNDHYHYPRQSFPVVLLTGVCYVWRTIAFSEPKLWSVMNINLQDDREATVIECLKKSENSLLSLRIHSAMSPSSSIPQGLSNALLECAHRWRELELCIDSTDELRSWLSLAALKLVPNFKSPHSTPSHANNVCFPALEYLHLPQDQHSLMIGYISCLFGMCPTLQSYRGELYSVANLNLSQIKKLHISYASDRTLGNLLRRFPNLTQCTVKEFGGGSNDPPDELDGTHISRITELSLASPYPQLYKSDDTFFRGVSLPCLISLELYGFEVIHGSQFDALCNLLLHSQCKLQKLKMWLGLTSRIQNFDRCIQLLSSHPHIISLTIVGFDGLECLERLADHFSSRIDTASNVHASVSPSIRSLDLSFSSGPRWPKKREKALDIADRLCRILRARTSLQIVSLYFGKTKWDDTSFQRHLTEVLRGRMGDSWVFCEAVDGKGEGVVVLPAKQSILSTH
ncbi:hypothetical protein GYMLUDRAFT_787712 [Collybiopsis luxurians FD-317 M1]|nr:hypothetical protein GYMLUDRAFT_787712 [Collybiopsis luxurians FD-317 M1]